MDGAAPEIAALRAKLADLDAQADELRAALDAAGPRGGVPTPPPGPQPAWDEVEVDSKVLDGVSGRREDRSLEWAADEISVLRLFSWRDSTLRTKTLGPDESSASDDGIRFLARVPKDAAHPSTGATLRYYRLHVPAPGGTITVVSDIGVADGYFYKDKTTYRFTGSAFVAVGNPVRTNIFPVATCSN